MHAKDMQKLRIALTEAMQNHQAGNLESAVQAYKKALKIQPANFDALHMLGVAYAAQELNDKAMDLIGRALKINPNSARANTNFGNTLRKTNRLNEALACHNKALKLQPSLIEAWHNKGHVLADMKSYDEAIAAYDHALAINPNQPKVLNDKAVSLLATERAEDAMVCSRTALEIQPDYLDALYNFGIALTSLEQHEEALMAFNTVIEAQPKNSDAYWYRGLVLEQLERIPEAVQDLDRAIELDPTKTQRQSARFYSKREYCCWDNHDAEWQRLAAEIEKGGDIGHPWLLMASPVHPRHLKTIAEAWVSKPENGLNKVTYAAQQPRNRSKIRIGYLSADFRLHPVAILTAQLFELHDKSNFEFHALSIKKKKTNDLMRTRIEKSFDHFHEVGHLTDEKICDFARQLEIDIAIDLTGITRDGRPGIFARRIAPIQAGYLGYAGTVSADLLDYLIADPFVIPPEYEEFYSEKIVRLPHTYMVNDATREVSKGKFKREDFNLPEDGLIFCCFNNSYKISPDIFDIWMRLLKQTPGSVLWIAESNPNVRERLQREAENRGMSSDRLVFAEHLDSLADHLGRLSLADLFLDCFYYNAHTTTIDALWGGLPVLTCPTNSFSGRVAGSILMAIGLPELIASSPEEYEEMALSFARSPEKLQIVREKLAKNKEIYPLFKTDLFARHLEDAFFAMWEQYEKDLPPDHIWVKSRQDFPTPT